MKINVLGDMDLPVIVAIHGAFCDYTSVMPFAGRLRKNFCVIMPTLDGHYEESANYSTVNKQARMLNIALHKMGIKKIAMLHGTSIGANVALCMGSVCDIEIENYFFDGGCFFEKSLPKRRLLTAKILKYARKSASSSDNEKLFSWLGKSMNAENPDIYRDMFALIASRLEFMSEKTVKNLVESCCKYSLPDFPDEVSERFFFNFSADEPAHKSKKRLMEKYPCASFNDFPHGGHCSFQLSQPDLYAKFVSDIILSK